MRYLLFFLLLLPGCGTKEIPLGASYEEIPSIITTSTFDYATATFKNNATGELTTISVTLEELLAGPKLAGHTLVETFQKTKPVTSTPILQDNQFHKAGQDTASSTLIKVKKPNEDPKIIREEDLTTKPQNIANVIN